jgi:hypothetical protein
MSVREFEEHIRAVAPAFRCYACGDHAESLNLTARLSNNLNRPASKKALATIESLLGAAGEPFKELYRRHNGMVLYRDSRSHAAGVRFFPVEEWAARSEEMRDGMLAMGWDEEEVRMPAWLKKGIVFGEIPQSANYFVVTVGRGAGKIHYADHDDFRNTPIAKKLEAFLDKILADPAGFLYKCGCYTRYSDGKTGIQWIPKEYVSDAS